jgi:hypothetical protein
MTAKDKELAEPGKIEALLPWRAAGTLSAEETQLVDEALAKDPALAKQYEVIKDELAETVLLNEELGAPSTRGGGKLFAAIDAEPARDASPASGLMARLGALCGGWSPRTLGWAAAAAAAMLVLVLQAGIITTAVVKHGSGYQTASSENPTAGTRALVGFKSDATLDQITAFLVAYHASIVSGPQAGMFTVKFGDTALAAADAEKLIAKVKADKIVTFAAATQ